MELVDYNDRCRPKNINIYSSAPGPVPDRIFIILRVDSNNEIATRSILRQYLGNQIESYTAKTHPHNEFCAFQIEIKSGCVDFLMHAIMEHLPRAEFGKIACNPNVFSSSDSHAG